MREEILGPQDPGPIGILAIEGREQHVGLERPGEGRLGRGDPLDAGPDALVVEQRLTQVVAAAVGVLDDDGYGRRRREQGDPEVVDEGMVQPDGGRARRRGAGGAVDAQVHVVEAPDARDDEVGVDCGTR